MPTNAKIRPALLPEDMSGQGLVWQILMEEELIRFAFLQKVRFTCQQLGLLAKFMGISFRLEAKTRSVDQAVQFAGAIAIRVLPDRDTADRLSIVRAIVEPIATRKQGLDPVLALVLEEMAKDNPSYKDFADLHNEVKGQLVAPAADEHSKEGRAGAARGPTIQVTDLAYRAAP
jgi:hypothetical protein